MGTGCSIPRIDVSALFHGPSRGRDIVDREIARAASETGFFVSSGLPPDVPIDRHSLAELLRVFQLTDQQKRRLWRKKFDPSHSNVYRGWFPVQTGNLTSKEGIDLGPDIVYGMSVVSDGDPLREATPLPAEDELPGWRSAVERYYRSMLRVGEALMHSFARSMNLPEDFFDRSFEHGISTLRLIRYPPRVDLDQAAAHHPDVWVEREGRRCHVSGAAHVDSGLVTLLAQDRVPGLQARHRAGHWIDIPPLDGTLAVNFGKVLERWSRGRMKATEHRVIGSDRERASIPFFYEARVDAAIRPLPMDPPDCFEPFLYGDHLWDRVTGFVEFHGMAGLRQARR